MNQKLPEIYEISNIYTKTFLNKNIEIIYRDANNKRKTINIICGPENFMHLCGVQSYATKENTESKRSREFYEHCIGRRLNTNRCRYRKENLHRKLKVLKCLEELIGTKSKVCGSGIYESLKYDNALRTNKEILALTLIKDNDENYRPNSCIDLSDSNKGRSKSFKSIFKITKISIKDNQLNLIKEIKPESATKKKRDKRRGKK